MMIRRTIMRRWMMIFNDEDDKDANIQDMDAYDLVDSLIDDENEDDN